MSTRGSGRTTFCVTVPSWKTRPPRLIAPNKQPSSFRFGNGHFFRHQVDRTYSRTGIIIKRVSHLKRRARRRGGMEYSTKMLAEKELFCDRGKYLDAANIAKRDERVNKLLIIYCCRSPSSSKSSKDGKGQMQESD